MRFNLWALVFAFLGLVGAEDGLAGWLRYASVANAQQYYSHLPATIVVLNSSTTSPVYTAGQELQKGIAGIFGKTVPIRNYDPKSSGALIVGTLEEYTATCGQLHPPPDLGPDGFWLNTKDRNIQIIGQNERGALYGAFQYLSTLAQADFTPVAYVSNPSAPIRWINQWDNLDGSIERGYGGNSIWFAGGTVISDMTRASQYARLLASIGINAVVVNNVNSDAQVLSTENIAGLGRIADAFRPYGVQLGISPLFSSPTSGVAGSKKLDTFDPVDPKVVAWWKDVTDRIHARIPDFAGYLVKASSEGQPGPITYNRTLDEGANLFAKAVKPYGGVVMFRAFVYQQNYNKNDWKADRANAANDYIQPLDGKFDDNVVVQIKYGPIDFQVREPNSPLFGNLRHSNTALELAVSQEYLGQQSHLVYEPTLWQTVLDFDMRTDGQQSLTRDIVTGKRFNRKLSGFAGVANVGTSSTWLGSHLAMSNLYAFGRLAWDPTNKPEDLIQDWTRLTYGQDRDVIDTITKMSMSSWLAYEGYTGNLGVETLVTVDGHFGPDPHSQDFSNAGRWFRADSFSIGMDRTVSNGTGNAGQYQPEVAQMYEGIDSTPDELFLWFHHANWTHVLHSGQTIIQHFYDAHYSGSNTVQAYVPMWQTLQGKIDDERYYAVLFQLYFQAGHSLVWRDAINTYFYNICKIADKSGRVGHHPYRIEAETMKLSGYKPVPVSPFETASNATAIITTSPSAPGTATTTLQFDHGTYDLAINYFDLSTGAASYQVFINDKKVGEWKGDQRQWVDGQGSPEVLGHYASSHLDGTSAIRTVFHGVEVWKGDVLRIVGMPDGGEMAPVDYVSFLPRGVVD